MDPFAGGVGVVCGSGPEEGPTATSSLLCHDTNESMNSNLNYSDKLLI